MKMYRTEGSNMRIAALLATDRHEIQRHADNPITINLHNNRHIMKADSEYRRLQDIIIADII